MAGKRANVPVAWVVANPRGIPDGRYILHHRDGDGRDVYWFEGDAYGGPVTDRLVRDGFIVREGVSGG